METIKLNITQLNSIIKRIIDAEDFLQSISVYGEVSNFKISGENAYFDIKEDGAGISCVKFGADGLDIHNGDMVLLTGKLNYYIKTGKLSFVASRIEPYGLGELYKQYLKLKEQLAAEGLFDEQYKKQIPRYASKVGVITSETGAVLRDIYHVARKKNPYTDIIVYPARVQGLLAENEIINGLKYFDSTDVDLIIIARGGGSFEDLAPFNTESLARAIFSTKKPVISAVGHETDFSLSDFASDMRAPTPSVAAEIAFYDFEKAKQSIAEKDKYIISALLSTVAFKKQELKLCTQSIAEQTKTSLKDNYSAINYVLSNCIANHKLKVSQQKALLDQLILSIEKSNPLNILKSGYAIVSKGDKKIDDICKIEIGDNINVKLKNGELLATVTKKENKK